MNQTRTRQSEKIEALNKEISRLDNLLVQRRSKLAQLSNGAESNENKPVAQALLESEETLRGILDNVEDAVITIDEKGTLCSFNRSAEKMFGYRADEIIGQPVEMLMPEPHRTRHGEYIHAYEKTGESQILGKGARELEGLRKDGATFPMELSIAEMLAGGRRRYIGTIRDISERKRAERVFRENAEELNAIYRTAGVGIAIADREGRFIRCNSKFEELLGYSEAELKSTNVPNISHPDEIEEDMRLRREIFEGRRNDYEIDKRLVRKDGTIIWILARIVALKNADGKITATVGIAEDITERKHSAAALEASEQRYRSLFETSKDGILIANMAGNIEDANPAILAMLGYDLKEIRGKTVEEITPQKWRNFTTNVRDELRHGPRDEYEKEYLHRDGSAVPVMVHVWRVDGGEDRQARVIAIVRDITESRQVEAQLRQAQKMEAIGQLTGGVAHDFNNLLTVISGNLEMISDEISDNQELSDMAARAIRATERGASLT